MSNLAFLFDSSWFEWWQFFESSSKIQVYVSITSHSKILKFKGWESKLNICQCQTWTWTKLKEHVFYGSDDEICKNCTLKFVNLVNEFVYKTLNWGYFTVSLPLWNKKQQKYTPFIYATYRKVFLFLSIFISIWSPFSVFSPWRNHSTLGNCCDVFLPGLSCQVGQGAVAAVKRFPATEGQSRSVIEEEAAFEFLFMTGRKRKKFKRFVVSMYKDIFLKVRMFLLVLANSKTACLRGRKSTFNICYMIKCAVQGLQVGILWRQVEFTFSTWVRSVYRTKTEYKLTVIEVSAPKH